MWFPLVLWVFSHCLPSDQPQACGWVVPAWLCGFPSPYCTPSALNSTPPALWISSTVPWLVGLWINHTSMVEWFSFNILCSTLLNLWSQQDFTNMYTCSEVELPPSPCIYKQDPHLSAELFFILFLSVIHSVFTYSTVWWLEGLWNHPSSMGLFLRITFWVI